MYVSIVYENQKTLTIFDIQSSSGIQVIEKLVLNGIDLIKNIDYTVAYPISSIAVISSLTPFLKTSDDLDIIFYAEDGVTIIDTLNNVPINFNYNYVEINGDVDNDVEPSDTTDKSIEMNTPLEIRGCQEIDINGHLLHIANIGAFTNSESAAILFNNIPVVSGDFDKSTHPSLLPLSFDGSGVLTTNLTEPTLIEFSSIAKTAPFNIEVTTTRIDGEGIDAFLLDNVGFRKVESSEPSWVDITGTNNPILPVPPIGTIFRIEITNTHINIICDSIILASYPRDVIYTSDKGLILPSGSQPYLSTVNFTPNSYGLGEIKATFGAISARQVIDVIIPRQPDFEEIYFQIFVLQLFLI